MEYHNLSNDPESAERPLTVSAKQDPFYVVKGKVEKLIVTLQEDYGRWRDLLNNSDTATGDFDALTKKLRMGVQTARIDLNDLQQTVNIVEKFRARFQDITDDELTKRRKFVNSMSAEVQEVENTLESSRTTAKVQQDRQRKDLFSKSQGGNNNDRATNNKIFTVQDRALNMEAQQDVVLDDMSAALSRLQNVGGSINTELRTHADMLAEMDEDMDQAMGTMGTVQKKMEKLLGKSDKGRLCCIFWLFALCVLLGFLIVYT